MKNYLTGFLMFGITFSTWAQSSVWNADTLKLSLKDAWNKAEEHSRDIKIKHLEVGISAEEVKDLRAERLPEVQIKGSAEKQAIYRFMKMAYFQNQVNMK